MRLIAFLGPGIAGIGLRSMSPMTGIVAILTPPIIPASGSGGALGFPSTGAMTNCGSLLGVVCAFAAACVFVAACVFAAACDFALAGAFVVPGFGRPSPLTDRRGRDDFAAALLAAAFLTAGLRAGGFKVLVDLDFAFILPP